MSVACLCVNCIVKANEFGKNSILDRMLTTCCCVIALGSQQVPPTTAPSTESSIQRSISWTFTRPRWNSRGYPSSGTPSKIRRLPERSSSFGGLGRLEFPSSWTRTSQIQSFSWIDPTAFRSIPSGFIPTVSRLNSTPPRPRTFLSCCGDARGSTW